MKRYRYALIGCGRIAKRHLAAARENAGRLSLTALCDLLPEKARSLGESWQADPPAAEQPPPGVFSGHRELLEKAEPEICAIAAESGAHARIALDCIEAGCHVLIEKPIALSLSDADLILRRAAARGVAVAVCHQNRFNPAMRQLSYLVSHGLIGKPYCGAAVLRWNRNRSYYEQAAWRGRWESDGGALMNQGIHAADLLLMAMGAPEEVTAYSARLGHPYIEAEDQVAAAIRFQSGALATLEAGVNIYPENLEETLSVFGGRGSFIAGGKALDRVLHCRVDGHAGLTHDEARFVPDAAPDEIYGEGHTALYRDFLDALGAGRPPLCGAGEGRAALELVLAIYRSAKTGKPVRFPLGGWSSAEMKGMFPESGNR